MPELGGGDESDTDGGCPTPLRLRTHLDFYFIYTARGCRHQRKSLRSPGMAVSSTHGKFIVEHRVRKYRERRPCLLGWKYERRSDEEKKVKKR